MSLLLSSLDPSVLLYYFDPVFSHTSHRPVNWTLASVHHASQRAMNSYQQVIMLSIARCSFLHGQCALLDGTWSGGGGFHWMEESHFLMHKVGQSSTMEHCISSGLCQSHAQCICSFNFKDLPVHSHSSQLSSESLVIHCSSSWLSLLVIPCCPP